MRSPPWRASDPSAARASAIRRPVNPSPPAILKSPPCAGFLIWIAEFAEKNPGSNRAALARRARCAARLGGRATRAQARASAFRRAVNPSPPAILKSPPCAGFLIWIAEFADKNPGSNRAALARRARCAARPGGRATRAQARASAFRRAVNPSPPAILKDPPCAGFLIWIAEFADLNPVRTEPRLRGELDAQPAWRASDPSAARASAFRRAVNPSPPAILKDPPCAGFLIWIAEFADENPGVRTEPRLRGELDAQPAWRASDPSAANPSL